MRGVRSIAQHLKPGKQAQLMIFNIHIVEIAAISALISMFLEFTFREGNIFSDWLDFLADLHLPVDVKEALNNDRDDRFNMVDWFWFKPLGGCVVCMNVWISFILCVVFYRRVAVELSMYGLFEFIAGALLVVLLSNFIVRFFQDKIV